MMQHKKKRGMVLALLAILMITLSAGNAGMGLLRAKASDTTSLDESSGNFERNTAGSMGGGYAVTGRLPGIGYMAVMYDATNGLPTSEANCILGSSAGYVWIGSYGGVIRHDGSGFERVPASTGMTNGRGLFEDSKQRVWVATNDNGVVVLTPYDS